MTRKVIFAIPNIVGGGVERLYVDLVRQLKKSGLELSCLLGSKIGAFEMPAGVPVFEVNDHDCVKRVKSIRAILERQKPHAIVSFLPPMNRDVIMAAMGTSVSRVIVTQHNVIYSSWRRGDGYRRVEKMAARFYPLADTVVAVSKGVKDDLVKHFPLPSKKVKVIYNGIEMDTINRLAEEKIGKPPWLKENIPVIVNIGALRRQKGQLCLLQAFSILRRNKDCRLLILGKGALETDLKLTAKRLGIEKFVYFLGFQDNPFKFLKRASLFVLSSLWEGFALVITEAMAVGVPVVSTDCLSGPNEIIKDGFNGLLVRPGNAAALARGMLKVLTTPSLAEKLSSNAKTHVKRFDIRKTAAQYLSLVSR